MHPVAVGIENVHEGLVEQWKGLDGKIDVNRFTSVA